jgi:hypothetical protein
MSRKLQKQPLHEKFNLTTYIPGEEVNKAIKDRGNVGDTSGKTEE